MSPPGLSPIPPRSIVCLADDDLPLPLLAEIAREFPQAVGEIWLATSMGEPIRERWQSAVPGSWKFVQEWEAWLGDPDIKLVLISTRDPAQLDALRQLAGSGRSIFLVPQLEHELSLAYELSLLADQSPFDVYPVRAEFPRKLFSELREDIRGGKLGQGIHLQLERKVSTTSLDASQTLSIKTLERHWVEDAAVLDFLAGPFSQLTATQAGATGSGAALGQIIVGSSGGPQAVWTCSPAQAASWKLTASGELGRIEIERQCIERQGDASFQMKRHLVVGQETTTTNSPEEYKQQEQNHREHNPEEQNREILNQIRGSFSGERHPSGLRELIRSFELLDASRRSLKRRRTIDLYYDAPTERGNFKTQMAAMGCGVLMYTLFAMLISLGVGEILRQIYVDPEHPQQILLPPWGNILMIALRIAAFGPLGLFLALQFLMTFTRKSRDR